MQIEQERGGLMIDWALLKNLLDFILEIRNYGGDNYYEDFEHAMLTQTSTYYSRLASEWLLYDSSADYIHKVSHHYIEIVIFIVDILMHSSVAD